MRALNFSAVFDETTEEGRLFHTGIVLRKKKNSSEHHYRPYILCIVNYELPWYFLSWVLGSDIYLYQETLYRSESCKRKLRKTSPCGPPGWPPEFVQHIVNATPVTPSPAGSPGCCLLHFLHLFCLSFIRPKKKRMFPITCQKKNGSIGRDFFFLREALPCKIPEHRYTCTV